MLSKPKRLLVYKIIAILFALFLFFMPENATILPDMDLRVIITTLALDNKAGEFQAAAQVIVPDKSGANEMKTASGKGNSVAMAMDELQHSIGKKADLKQCVMLVVGDGLAKTDIVKPLSYLLSSAEVSPGAAVVYAKDIEKFIEQAAALTDSSGTGISSFTLFNRNAINLPTITLLEALSGLNAPSGCIYLPHVLLDSSAPPSDKMQESAAAGAQHGESVKVNAVKKSETITSHIFQEKSENNPTPSLQEKEATIKKLVDVVVIKGNKMVAELDGDKTGGITWIEKASNRGLIQVDDFIFDGESLGAVPAKLKYKSVKIKVKFNGDIPEVTFKISTVLQLVDKQVIGCRTDQCANLIKGVEAAFTQLISAQIESSLNAAKLIDGDFLQLKTQFNRFCPVKLREFNDKDNFLNSIVPKFDIKVRIK